MIEITIPYYSRSGHTHKLADLISQGTQRVENVNTVLVDVNKITLTEWERLHASDAIIFGTPTYLGNVAGIYKLFLEKTSSFWISQNWGNKIAGGFTVGSARSGDKLNTLISLSLIAAEHGMIWAGLNHVGSLHTKEKININADGSWLGLMATSHRDKTKLIHKRDEHTARLFGHRIADVTKRWKKV